MLDMDGKFTDVPDELWERIQRWIPPNVRSPFAGPKFLPDPTIMSGILYRLRTGCQWDAIPKASGSGRTCYRRFVKWRDAGVFKMMHVEMSASSRNRKRNWYAGWRKRWNPLKRYIGKFTTSY